MKETEKNVNEFEVKEVEFNGFKLRYSDEVVKKIFELTDEDIEKLASVNYASVKSVYNKRTKSWRYLLTVHLLANRIIDTININLQKMNLICSTQNVPFDSLRELNETRIDCKVRFLHGITSATSLNPNKPYVSCQLFPIKKNNIGVHRNALYENLFIEETRLSEFLIYKMLDKITFKTASSDELEPIASFEDLQY